MVLSLFGYLCNYILFWNRNVDDVHDIMDDLSEQNEIAEEIANAISQPIGFAQELDDVGNLCV